MKEIFFSHPTSMYSFFSKPIYFHPPGMKPSMKPSQLIQHSEKPFNFTYSCLIYSSQCSFLILASLPFFDYHSDLFQLDGVSRAK